MAFLSSRGTRDHTRNSTKIGLIEMSIRTLCHPEERGIPTRSSTKIGELLCGIPSVILRSSG